MPLRRLVGLLTAAFMLHLNVVEVDAACAAHDGAAAASGMSEHHADMPEHASAGASAVTERGEDCQTPVKADCCLAMVSCSTIGIATAVEQTGVRIARASIIEGAAGTLLSRATAPEPPPPKA